jgi:hypothetical protein
MTVNHPFDPSCAPVFSRRACQAAEGYRSDSRELFYRLLHVGEHYDVLPLTYHFVKQTLIVNRGKADFDEPEGDPYSCPGVNPEDRLEVRFGLLQFAPVFLTEPCWLENATQAATGATQIAADLLSIYLRLSQTPPNIGDRFRSLLLRLDIPLTPLASWEFAQSRHIDGAMYDFAAIQLALAQYPRTFLPEILGFTLAYCRASGFVEGMFHAAEQHGAEALQSFLSLRRQVAESQLSALETTVVAYTALFPEQAEALQERIQSGVWLYRRLLQHCRRRLRQMQAHLRSPRTALINVLRSKAPYAFGHHGRIELQGKSMDKWFGAKPFDAGGFLDALKHSPYVDLQQPHASPLFKFFEFEGPMFGVFDEQDIRLMEKWLLAEQRGIGIEPQQEAPDTGWSAVLTDPMPISEDRDDEERYRRLSSRELYYYLVNAELFPEVLMAAKHKARSVLRYARCLHRLPFSMYSHRRFEAHFKEVYDREISRYRPLDGPPRLSKDVYRWGIEQFAPAILTDGCWLQRTARLCNDSQRYIGKTLYRIFCDEAGSGRLEQNHPLIYRRLLESLGIHLPPIHSRAFLEHPGFIGKAFDLPVYLMSIAAFPNTFLPELLGLNLAIELNGLGRFYMRLAEGLEYWGIDAGIVKVHISADNFASGHAAMAKQAVQVYLDEILAGQGTGEMQRHWRRVYSGYVSLGVAILPFLVSLASRYFLRRLA